MDGRGPPREPILLPNAPELLPSVAAPKPSEPWALRAVDREGGGGEVAPMASGRVTASPRVVAGGRSASPGAPEGGEPTGGGSRGSVMEGSGGGEGATRGARDM